MHSVPTLLSHLSLLPQFIWNICLSFTTSCQSSLVSSSRKFSLSTSMLLREMRLTSSSCV